MIINPRSLSSLFFSIAIFVFSLSGCGDVKEAASVKNNLHNTLTFSPKYQNRTLKCLSPFIHQGKAWQYSQLQLFVSDVEVKINTGQWLVWQLSKNKYQSDNVALLGEYCQGNAIKQQQIKGNWQLLFEQSIDPSTISQLRFTLGVPFSLNHQNPLLQSSPLNIPNMFWVWQTGHKFFRLDMEEVNDLEQKDNWQFHLGSTGCKAPSPLRSPKTPCINGNQVKITLDINESIKGEGFESINIDLTSLFSELIITKQNSCQSEPENDSCLPLFKTMGLLQSGVHQKQQQLLFKFNESKETMGISN